jgi:hypothetical protein
VARAEAKLKVMGASKYISMIDDQARLALWPHPTYQHTPRAQPTSFSIGSASIAIHNKEIY